MSTIRPQHVKTIHIGLPAGLMVVSKLDAHSDFWSVHLNQLNY